MSWPNGIEVTVNWANETTTKHPMTNSTKDLQLLRRMIKDGSFILEIVVANSVSSQHITLPVSYSGTSATHNESH